MGQDVAAGLNITVPSYWDKDDESRAWSKRFMDRNNGVVPTYIMMGVYSAMTHYLKAVQAAGTDAGPAVVARMKSTRISDPFMKNIAIREDGQVMRPLYPVEVKPVSASKSKYDYYKLGARDSARADLPPDRRRRLRLRQEVIGTHAARAMSSPRLFTPWQMRRVVARNRVAISPMQQYSAEQGEANDWHLAHLARFAMGGAGIVFVGSTAVEERGRNTHGDLGLWDERQSSRSGAWHGRCGAAARWPASSWAIAGARPACRNGGRGMVRWVRRMPRAARAPGR
jgi:hypothetical protein